MISRATTEAVLNAIVEWSEENEVSGEAVAELINSISKISGNKSFQQSVAALALLVRENVDHNQALEEAITEDDR